MASRYLCTEVHACMWLGRRAQGVPRSLKQGRSEVLGLTLPGILWPSSCDQRLSSAVHEFQT